MDNEKSDWRSWLIPAVVAAAVTLGTTATTVLVQKNQDSIANEREDHRLAREDAREIVKLRAEILKAANDSKSLGFAKLMFDHVLTKLECPADVKARRECPPDLDTFSRDLNEHIADAATTVPAGQVPQDLTRAAPPASGSVAQLIAKLGGDERLAASNALIERAFNDKAGVTKALIDAIQEPNEKNAYRVNLYIAFTLSRLHGGWSGTSDQLAKVQRLASPSTPQTRDPTFRARVNDALRAYVK